MAFENLLPKLIAQTGKWGAIKHLDQQGPPSYDDVLHDGLVQSGKTVGSTLGGAAGWWGGRAIGGLPGAVAGMATLGSLGHLAGGWAGHTAYLQGPLIKDIISHPENWTVDAAGAIVPVMPPSAAPSDAIHSNNPGAQPVRRLSIVWGSAQPSASGDQSVVRPGVFDTGAPSLPFTASTNIPGGLPGLLAEAGFSDPRNPDTATPGGLPGLIQEYLRTSSPRAN